MKKQESSGKSQVARVKAKFSGLWLASLRLRSGTLATGHSQSGIAQMVIVFLLLAGVALGTYLVQQKTNLLPKAEENTCSYSEFCDAGSGPGSGTHTCTGTNPNGAGENQCGYNPAVYPACSACQPLSGGGTPAEPKVCEPAVGEFRTVCGDEEAAKVACENADPNHQYRVKRSLSPRNTCTWSCVEDKNTSPDCPANGGGSTTTTDCGTASDKTTACDGQSLFDGNQGDAPYRFREKCGDLAAQGWVKEHEKAINYCQGGGGGTTTHTCPDEGLVYCDSGKTIKKVNARWNDTSQKCDYDFEDITSTNNACQGQSDGTVITPGTPKTITSGVTGGTNPCRDNPITPPQGNQWVADCAKSCTQKSECPLPNPPNSNISNQDEGRQCYVFDGGNRCMVLKEGTSLTCNASVATTNYFDTKVATNLAYYEAIVRGVPNSCVKADLGLDPHIFAHTQSDNKEGRLFLCAGVNNKPGSLDLTWRVLSADGQSLVLTKESPSLNPSAPACSGQSLDNCWPNSSQVQQARTLLGVSVQ